MKFLVFSSPSGRNRDFAVVVYSNQFFEAFKNTFSILATNFYLFRDVPQLSKTNGMLFRIKKNFCRLIPLHVESCTFSISFSTFGSNPIHGTTGKSDLYVRAHNAINRAETSSAYCGYVAPLQNV